MIIDTNAFLGHYPFRRMAARTVQEMIELMDRSSIDRAVVSSLHAVFYRDAHRGNLELFEETKAHGDRFTCIATVNPKYVGWVKDMEQAIDEWKMNAVTLVPAHHGYALTDDFCKAAIAKIVEYDVPLVLTQRFEDRRQRHHWDIAEDLELKVVLELARMWPTLKIVLNNWIGLDGARLKDAGLKGRCLIDFARLHVLLNQDVSKLITELGIEAISFGSHMPFDYTAPSLVKLANLETLSADEYERISWRNAASFFKIS